MRDANRSGVAVTVTFRSMVTGILPHSAPLRTRESFKTTVSTAWFASAAWSSLVLATGTLLPKLLVCAQDTRPSPDSSRRQPQAQVKVLRKPQKLPIFAPK